jgi:SAM-dependent methyltransferase
MSVLEHYEKHLGPVYKWMVGDAQAAVAANVAFLGGLGLGSKDRGLAVDLGSGTGLQTFALEKLGYFVLAVDECRGLVEELRRETDRLAVRVAEDDVHNFRRYIDEDVELVVCMGDTLSHLGDEGEVESLIRDVATALVPGGVFVTTFRDFSIEKVGSRKSILVKGDDRRILTCQLEYGEKKVAVTDLLHEREAGGAWGLRVSSYEKVRLAPEWVAEVMREAGFEVEKRAAGGGMVGLIGRKALGG